MPPTQKRPQKKLAKKTTQKNSKAYAARLVLISDDDVVQLTRIGDRNSANRLLQLDLSAGCSSGRAIRLPKTSLFSDLFTLVNGT